MAQFDGMVLTNDGIDLLGKVQAGQELAFTRFAIGDGELVGELKNLTELINETFSLEIHHIEELGNGRVKLDTVLKNDSNPVGSYVREIGLFANDPDKGEILYIVANAGDEADYLPPSNSGDVYENLINLIIFTGNDATVTATIEQTVSPTMEQFNAHTNDDEVHITQQERENWNDAKEKIDSHANNQINPHNVTVEQIGAETPEGAQEKADQAEMRSNDKFIEFYERANCGDSIH